MTRIDFYILPDVALSALNRFACALAAKAVSSGHTVLLHAADEAAGREIDELLWHYPDRRFLPHAVVHGTETDRGRVPVRIGWEPPERYEGVLINLTTGVPDFFARFQRVAEIVVQDTRDKGRDRYRFYRRRGYPLYDHAMDDWEAGPGV